MTVASYIPLMVIALAVSLDGCSVGMLYGVRRIRIPLLSLIVISLCSGLIIWCSMKAGQLVTTWLPPEAAKAAGAGILVAIGLWAIIQFFLQNRTSTTIEQEQATVVAIRSERRAILHIELRKLGLVIQILRSPSIADMDRSGNISVWEAALLGIALSLDALGAGIGAAMVGYHAMGTALLIAAASGLFLALGLRMGKFAARLRWMRRLSLLPGLLLVTMGIMKLLI